MSFVLKKREKEKAEFDLAIFVVATLSFNLITLPINLLVGLFVSKTSLDTAFCLLIYFYLFLRALPTIISRVSKRDLIFVLVLTMLFLVSMLSKGNFYYIINSISIFPILILNYFVGRSISNDSYIEKIVFKATPYIILVSFVTFFLTTSFAETQNEDNMGFAYLLLPFSIFSAFRMIKIKEKKILNVLVFIGALFLQIWTGTRGPLLCLITAIIVFIILNPGRASNKIVWALILIALMAFLSSNAFIDVVEKIANYLEKIGFSNRIVDYILQGQISDSSGREFLTERMFLAIEENPLFGYGLFGDRVILDGHYCHNIFMEFLINFGILFGSVLFVSLVVLLLVSLVRRKENSAMILMLICSGFVKLFLSNSYIIEPLFFMLLGVAFTKPKLDKAIDLN